MLYYVSIHDVKPNNLKKIEVIISLLHKHNIHKITILVVPGLNWKKKHIEQLYNWQNYGIKLAAHGWQHKASLKKTFYHKIHSVIMSGECAEHLSKNEDEIINIVKNSYNWFNKNNLNIPKLYVPPAWAIGNIRKQSIANLPFKTIECTTGVIKNKKYYFVPLIGFEARNLYKAFFLKIFNKFNYILALFWGKVRLGIHPDDFELYLNKDINIYLKKVKKTFILYEN